MGNIRRIKTESLTLVAVLLSVGVSACGGAAENTGSTSPGPSNPTAIHSTSTTTANGQSGDSTGSDRADVILGYGRPASETEDAAITARVKHYYAAAAADDGATACSQIYLIFREAIPEDYGMAPGPPSLRGKTCAVVMSKLFKQHHRELVADSAKLRVTGARIEGKQGYALLSLGGESGLRAIQLHTELGAWEIDSLLDGPLP